MKKNKIKKEKNLQPRIPLSNKLSFIIEKNRDIQNLKEFITTKPALQEMLKGILEWKEKPINTDKKDRKHKCSKITVSIKVSQGFHKIKEHKAWHHIPKSWVGVKSQEWVQISTLNIECCMHNML